MKNRIKVAAIGGASALGTLAMGLYAHAAADTTLVADAGTAATALQENAQGVLGEFYVIAAICGGAVGVLWLVYRLIKRAASGR